MTELRRNTRLVIATATAAAVGGLFIVGSNGRLGELSGWAQFFGAMMGLIIAYEFGRQQAEFAKQEASDRRAESANLALIRAQELEDREKAEAELWQKWVDLPTYCLHKIDLTIEALKEHRSLASSISLADVRTRATDLAASADALDYMMRFEPPSMVMGACLVETRQNVLRAVESFDTFINKTDKSLTRFAASAHIYTLESCRANIMLWLEDIDPTPSATVDGSTSDGGSQPRDPGETADN